MPNKDPPYSLDFFQTIVDVHFGGLAVEFDIPVKQDNSHLQLAGGIPGFKKAIMNLWFRAPAASLKDVADKWETDKTSRLAGYLPLVVFGPLYEKTIVNTRSADPYVQTRYHSSFNSATGYAALSSPTTQNLFHTTEAFADGTVHKNPSFIGIEARWVHDEHDLPTTQMQTALVIHIQMADKGAATWVHPITISNIADSVILDSAVVDPMVLSPTTDTAYDFNAGICRTDAVYPNGGTPNGTQFETESFEDGSDFYVNSYGPEEFTGRVTKPDSGSILHPDTIQPDHWHNAIISFDLAKHTRGEGVLSVVTIDDCPNPHTATLIRESVQRKIVNPCKMWVALDDVNYTHLDPSGLAAFVGLGPNGIATRNTMDAAIAVNSVGLHDKAWDVTGLVRVIDRTDEQELPVYSYTPGNVPSGPFGIPATTALASTIRDVEMAEFIMWTGKSVDTSKLAVRRLFVDAKGKPVDPKVAIKALGPPVIQLHGSSKWIKGDNTASKKAPDFKPLGDIERYRPDPSLHGPQSPSDIKR